MVAPQRIVISVRGVRKRFGRVQAVEDFSLEVPAGEILGLVGPNGSGKTTALRCLCGILKMDAGSSSIEGSDINRAAVAARRVLAYVPEVPTPFAFLTPMEHMLFTARAYELDGGWQERAASLLQELGLAEKQNTLSVDLSKGQRQKIHLAMAMLRAPNALVLDEPLIGIDPKGAHILKRWIRERKTAGAAGIVSTHVLPLVSEVCDRVAIMSHGRLVATGTFEEIARTADLDAGATFEEVFLSLTENQGGRP